MKKLLALAAVVAVLASASISSAAEVQKTLILKFNTATQTLFDFNLVDDANNVIPDSTVDKGTFVQDPADGSTIDFQNMFVRVLNNQASNFTLSANFTNFSSAYGIDNILGAYAWSGVPAGSEAGLADISGYDPETNPIADAGDVLIYSGTDADIKVNVGVGTYVPANAQGGEYVATVAFTLANA